MEKKNQYPMILVHGFLGYGDEDGVSRFISGWGFGPGKNAVRHLNRLGYETYGPAVGPFNNPWDRACELYYHLVGGKVDYGKYHSELYGHARYGRTYPGVLKDWGTPGKHAKVNFIGHSLGSPTIRILSNLLAYGSEEEKAVTPESELNALFTGGKADWIHSITTLAGVNNGTMLASFMKEKGARGFQTGYLMLVAMLGDSLFNSQLIDFHMEQWGLMQNPETRKRPKLHSPFSKMAEIRNYNKNVRGGIVFDMQLQQMVQLNKELKILPGVYYFARPGMKSHDNGKGRWVVDKDASLLAKAAGRITGSYQDPAMEAYGYSRPAWDPHDGFVNTQGAVAPYSEPSAEYKADTELKKGIWYTFPPVGIDHTGFMGMGMKKKAYHDYFAEVAALAASLPE